MVDIHISTCKTEAKMGPKGFEKSMEVIKRSSGFPERNRSEKDPLRIFCM